MALCLKSPYHIHTHILSEQTNKVRHLLYFKLHQFLSLILFYNWLLLSWVTGKTVKQFLKKNLQPCGTPQDKKKTMIGTVVTIICTHLHSSVRRSQVQFVGLHSWGGSFLSQNKRASVTSLVFSIQQRTIVTDQELHNNTLPPQHKKRDHMLKEFLWKLSKELFLILTHWTD